MEKKGYFITFEGGEGCGKSTQNKKFEEYLKSKNVDFLITREPGGYPLCEEIRKILLHSSDDMFNKTEFLLFSASRAELTERVIKPALAVGKTVVCDRFYDSSIVYQGGARGLGEDNVRMITAFAIGDLKPDVTIYLKINPERGFERKGGADQTDRMETAGLEFHKKVFQKYNELAEQEPDRFLVVDATQPIEKVFDDIICGLKEKGIVFDEV